MPIDDEPTAPASPGAARRKLLDRLDAIGAALAARDDALALLALGSAGRADAHIDEHSDLDFFVLVRDGAKPRYIDDLSWLAAAAPLVWHFRNTADGCKAVMHDGVFCEFAVFELGELAAIPYAPGRFVWRRDAVDPALAMPARALPGPSDAQWLAGEALCNLLVGLHRFARGERLAAMRLVQVHALDRVLALREQRGPVDATVERDAFAVERRAEQRLPGLAAVLPLWAPGYDSTPRAALALLGELQTLHDVSPVVADQIRSLAGRLV